MTNPNFNSYTSTFTNVDKNNKDLTRVKNQVEEILKAIKTPKRF